MKELPSPLNAHESYLYGINVRLEVLIEQLSSLVEHIAQKEGVSVESGQVEVMQSPLPKKTRKRGAVNES
jgi:hypothetical protein